MKDGQIAYKLLLGNSQEWLFVAEEDARAWLDKFASILKLDFGEHNGCPRFIFVRKKVMHTTDWTVHYRGLIRFLSSPKSKDIICEIGAEEGYRLDFIKMWQALYLIYERALAAGGLPLHSALVERGGIGVLLAAPGKTGKSTCCRRIPYPWRALCDDEVLVAISTKNERYIVHPFPTWSDYLLKRSEKRWDVEKNTSLGAIFFLEPSEADEIIPLGQGRAAAFINHSAQEVCFRYQEKVDFEKQWDIRENIFYNACKLAKSVPSFTLRASLNGKFWEKMEDALCSIKVPA